MKIVIAPDSYKESLTALEASNAIERGFKEIFPEAEYVKVPMADGGEGTVQSLIDATNGKRMYKEVTGPLGDRVQAFFGLLGDGETAVIEMAAASGLHLVPIEKRNPLLTSSRGTGELIRAALDLGVNRIIIGLGGSATNDGGAGMIQALGGNLLDRNGNELLPGGGRLAELVKIDLTQLDPRIHGVEIEVACDVDNPLIGAHGASVIFGPQKGATREMVEFLDKQLSHFADVIETQLQTSIKKLSGAGAAGGLGGGIVAFLNGKLKKGIDIVIDAVQLEKRMLGASIVITGEGRMDSQTMYGKTPMGVAGVAIDQNVPVIGLSGSLSPDHDVLLENGFTALYSIIPGVVNHSEAYEHASLYLQQTARNVAATMKIGMSLK